MRRWAWLTRSAPQLNVMALGFGINIALALVVVAACLPFLPGAMTTLVERAVTDTLGLLGIGNLRGWGRRCRPGRTSTHGQRNPLSAANGRPAEGRVADP